MGIGILSRYSDRLPLKKNDDEEFLTLGEGNTPLIPLNNFDILQNIKIYVKYEGLNPTGSFKDRGMVAAIASAKQSGAKCVICASTGNTSASASAYAARVKLPCIVLMPEGKVAKGKIAQAVAHGAIIVQIAGNFDNAMQAVRKFIDSGAVCVVNSINPLRLQGQKTAAFEIIEQLQQAPDYHALPVGNAGNITAHWIGYSEAAGKQTASCYFCNGQCAYINNSSANGKTPVMLGYQAAGSAPFVEGHAVDNPETIATAIRIGNPQSFEAAKIVLAESGGWVEKVSDEQILNVQKLLAEKEGVFCEPASSASVAGVLQDIERGKIQSNSTVVCTLTGHGLKDPDIFHKPEIQAVKLDDLSDFIMTIINKIT